MAKKTKKAGSGSFVRACAYFALLIAAGLFLVDGILVLLELKDDLAKVLSLLNLIGKLCLAVGIAFAAYEFTCGKKMIWRILFWIALLIYVLGCVLGVLW